MATQQPNIVLIMNDDMGYSDIGCYGGEIMTPNLDRLAANGVRFTQFYNTARCSPTRASLLTGLHPHQTGIGVLVDNDGPEGYAGTLNDRCVTIAEVLKEDGYRTYMSGKWHTVNDVVNSNGAWPRQRGFDRFYGIIIGAVSYYSPTTLTRENENVEREALEDDDYYITDAISDQAVKYIREHSERHAGEPFFQYVAYTAPHWPLHAREEDISKYKGRYDEGWDQLREERLERLVSMGILDPAWKLTERDPSQPAWEDTDDKEWRARCMEVYAAQIDRMDQGIGAIVKALEETGELDNTLIIFLADNGGCAEELRASMDDFLIQYHMATRQTKHGETVLFGNRHDYMPGDELTYQSYGIAWANLSNAPFRLYKHWIHEGGISTPLIMHWPEKVADEGSLRHTPGQLPDIMATILEATGAKYPSEYKGRGILPLEGTSLLPLLEQDGMERGPLFWEHEGNAGVREGKWKLVRKYPDAWELYDMERDRTELHDVAGRHSERVTQMSAQYEQWAERCRVIPREKILSIGSAVAAAFNEE